MHLPPNAEQIRAFNLGRRALEPYSLCHAPSISLNFDQTGNVTACCFNRQHVLGSYPENTLEEIWHGAPINELRRSLERNDLSLGCQQCGKMLVENNFESVLIRHFDDHAPLSKGLRGGRSFNPFGIFGKAAKQMPIMFEFEISNQCNLECIMCGGKWSSAIRKNREKLPPLKSPYDGGFVEQVRAFLPGLARANFLGGEPFLIGIYYDIWESIIEINPSIDVAITSNGTMLNDRGKRIISKLKNCRITLSIDSLRKQTWENIRRNGQFEILEGNIDWLIKSKKLRSFSVCPMVQNWQEIPEIMAFCNKHGLDIYFNIVYGPLGGKLEGVHSSGERSVAGSGLLPEVSLQCLDAAGLEQVIHFYSGQQFPKRLQMQLDHLIAQLKHWHRQKTT